MIRARLACRLNAPTNSSGHVSKATARVSRFVSKNLRSRYDIIQVGVYHATAAGAGNAFSREFMAQLRTMLKPDGVLTLNPYSAAVRGLLDVFTNIVVVSTRDHSNAGSIAANHHAVGSGPRVDHVIAWNNDDTGAFRERLLHESSRFAAIIPADPARPIPDARPNWETGCLIFAPDARRLLAHIRPATDDLPVTEYFLNQFQAVTPIAAQDPRVWGSPASCMPLRLLVRR